ncbi:MAG: DUF302 domain-containing protein [Cyanothece sp. SIO1E1]|nr:DUF302 domain-containing protein [Cyanothece sp. SIO1E1]
MQRLLFVLTATLLCSLSFQACSDRPQADSNASTTEGASLANDGIITLKSNYSVDETARRFESLINERSLTLFTQVDHAAGARSIEQELRPTRLIIFGNPKVGTPLMQCNQSVAIDLPQKMLIWEDETGQVWVSYNDPDYLMTRHRLTGCEPVIARVKDVLGTLAKVAAQS